MRVTHISIIHKPFDPRIFEKQCRSLAAAGHEVHLVIPAPQAEEKDGVRLHPVSAVADRPRVRGQLRRLWRAAVWARRLRPSVYHLHDPHLIPLGLVLALAGAHVVYDVHEDYQAHARAKLAGHPVRAGLKALTWRGLEWLARRALTAFVCASPELAQRFPAGRTTVVGNFPHRQEFARARAGDSVRPYRERPNRLIHTGFAWEIRCFWETARALELLPLELDCRLRMIGGFRSPELASAARALDAWARMESLPWQPHPVVVREMLDARVGLALLRPLPNHDDPVRSNKLFEYMAAGIPVIASDFPSWREIVCGVGCGLVVDPCEPAAIAAAIERLLADPDEAEAMGARGQAAVDSVFNWEGEVPRLLALYDRFEARPDVAAYTASRREISSRSSACVTAHSRAAERSAASASSGASSS